MNTKATLENGAWELTVVGVHRDKTLYFYGSAKVAFGIWATVMVKTKNLQSGTDYLERNLSWYVAAIPSAKIVRHDPLAPDDYAAYMFCGCSTSFTDINPGSEHVVVMVFDVPEDTTELRIVSASDQPLQPVFGITNFDQVPKYTPNN
jgi:hypothetical protein